MAIAHSTSVIEGTVGKVIVFSPELIEMPHRAVNQALHGREKAVGSGPHFDRLRIWVSS